MRKSAEPLRQKYLFGKEKYTCPSCDYPIGNTDEKGISRVVACPQCKQPLDWGDVV